MTIKANTEDAELEHSVVENMDAPSTLAETEPVRVYATAPLTILSIAGGIIALGVGSPATALVLAIVVVVGVPLLEAVRARVSPAPALDTAVGDPEAPVGQ